MANALYAKAKQRALVGGMNLSAGNIKAVLVVIGVGHYQVNLTTDEKLTAIAAGDRIVTSANFTTKSVINGVFDADDLFFSLVPAGAAMGALVIYEDVDGTAANALLIEYRDADTGLPITPTGSDIDYVWDNGANKIFSL